nr:MAG TPA: Protein of unknown function (DUF1360) [Caudoviricetes sp.]
MPTLYQIILTSLLTAFLILYSNKTGIRYKIRDYLDLHYNNKLTNLISRMLDCDFCLSFWLSLVIIIVTVVMLQNPKLFFIPIFSTPITRILI